MSPANSTFWPLGTIDHLRRRRSPPCAREPAPENPCTLVTSLTDESASFFSSNAGLLRSQ
jgi:hypothetical protein